MRLIKLIDSAIPAAAPTIAAQVPSEAKAGEAITLSAQATGVPALSYRWDFGDGTLQTATAVNNIAHTYTSIGTFTAKVTLTNNLGGLGSAVITVLVQ